MQSAPVVEVVSEKEQRHIWPSQQVQFILELKDSSQSQVNDVNK